MTSPTDLAERLRDIGNDLRDADDRATVFVAADALDRLSALESAASQREKNVAYVAFCIKSALDNGEKPVQDVTLENWLDYLEGRANAPGPGETWSDVAQPNDAKKVDANITVNGNEHLVEGRTISYEQVAREKAWREYADKIEVDYTAPTVQDDFKAGWDAARSQPRVVSEAAVEAMEARAKFIKACADDGQVWARPDITPFDYILTGKEDPR